MKGQQWRRCSPVNGIIIITIIPHYIVQWNLTYPATLIIRYPCSCSLTDAHHQVGLLHVRSGHFFSCLFLYLPFCILIMQNVFSVGNINLADNLSVNIMNYYPYPHPATLWSHWGRKGEIPLYIHVIIIII